jgi:hypothetical protein
VLREVDENPHEIIERIVGDVIQLYIPKEVLHE